MKKENLYAGIGVIRTNSGRYINLKDIDYDQIVIEDIAHALSNICRWGGHVDKFYSVAEHSVHVVMLMENHNELNPDDQYTKRELLAGLLHDAVEAYLCDMPSPIKRMLPDYQKLEKGVQSIIQTRFGIETFDVSKESDKISLEMEWDMWLNGTINGAKPKKAKKRFLEVFERLTRIEHNYDSCEDLPNTLIDSCLIQSGNELAKELESLENYPKELTTEKDYQCNPKEIEDDYARREKLLKSSSPQLEEWSEDFVRMKWEKENEYTTIGSVWGFDISFKIKSCRHTKLHHAFDLNGTIMQSCFDTLEYAKQYCREQALIKIKAQ